MSDQRRHAPATQRNRDPILEVLRAALPRTGLVLEVASGTGEHAAYFSQHLPGLQWQPSDPSPDALASIAAWRDAEGAGNLLPPVELDAVSDYWPLTRADAVVCINMIHISPWEATLGLMRGAAQLLGEGAPLVLYGPFRRKGNPIEPSNAAFDADLRRRDSRWGLREVEEVNLVAQKYGFAFSSLHPMPANNLSIVYHRI